MTIRNISHTIVSHPKGLSESYCWNSQTQTRFGRGGIEFVAPPSTKLRLVPLPRRRERLDVARAVQRGILSRLRGRGTAVRRWRGE